jgi:hypothetical protein
MAIEFTCPNGHPLRTRDDDAGKTAKCPKCGAISKVPGQNGSASKISSGEAASVASASAKGMLAKGAVGESAAGKSSPSAGAFTQYKSDSGLAAAAVGGQSGAGGAEATKPTVESGAREESIVFLCPNGHKLNAPRRLQGHAGKCPQCGAKFQIPFVEETGAEDEGSRVYDLGNFREILESGPTNSAANPAAGASADPASSQSAKSPVEEFRTSESDRHVLAALVTRLWSEREHGGIIELHLASGAIFLPDWFERRLSQSTHGLFATQAADGTVTMTIVPWDTITRVVVRGVVGLPDGMFE